MGTDPHIVAETEKSDVLYVKKETMIKKSVKNLCHKISVSDYSGPESSMQFCKQNQFIVSVASLPGKRYHF